MQPSASASDAGQRLGVLARPLARELHAHGGAVDAREVSGARGREHGQRGVRDRGVFGEHGDGARAAVVQECEHAVRLHGQRKVAAVVAHARVLGHERLRRNRPQQRMLGEVHVEHGLVITGGLGARRHCERRHAAPRAPQVFDVHIGDGESLTERLGLCEHAAVFGDDLLTADRHVARRIALPGATVRIAAQQARALPADQPAAVERSFSSDAFDAEPLQMTVAPATASRIDGGSGDQMSSQISYPTHSCGNWRQRNT